MRNPAVKHRVRIFFKNDKLMFLYYIAFCILVGLLAWNRKSGFVITFILSLFFTPVIVGLMLLVTRERKN